MFNETSLDSSMREKNLFFKIRKKHKIAKTNTTLTERIKNKLLFSSEDAPSEALSLMIIVFF